MRDDDHTVITRRDALKAIGAAVGTVALAACDPLPRSTMHTAPTTTTRMPTVFLPHGGGPWPFLDDSVIGNPGGWGLMAQYMRDLRMVPPAPPAAVLLISAHWEEPVPTVMTAAKPPLLYDYYGFPKEAYEVVWPAPGAPEVAAKVVDLLEGAGIVTGRDAERGFDHGVFVPLLLAYPDANVPTFQLSLKAGLDPAEHLAMGRALAPLRDEGVFIVGSGMSYHNLRVLMTNMRRGASGSIPESHRFDEWLAESMALEPSARETRLIEWEKAPAARESHPREEHLLPLMVVAGAAGDDPGTLPYRDVVLGAAVSATHFG